jgi:hypothetical protein
MLRLAAIFLLYGWCCLGLLHTGYVMVRPRGLIIHRPPDLARTLGLPSLDDGQAVAAILELLDLTAELPEGPVLVRRPEGEEQGSRDYIHFQVAHQAYPRRIDLVGAGTAPPLALEGYSAVIAPRGALADLAWRPLREHAGLILYRLPAP